MSSFLKIMVLAGASTLAVTLLILAIAPATPFWVYLMLAACIGVAVAAVLDPNR